MRKGNELSIKEAISQMVSDYKLAPKLNETRVVESWERIMGKPVSNRTEKISIRDKKMFVTLSSSVLREELQFTKTKILERINQEMGEEIITDLIFI